MTTARRHEYRLEALRRRTQNCGCDKYPCDHTFYEGVLFSGDDAYKDKKAFRGAFDKGVAAWKAGEAWHTNPYFHQRVSPDRKGRRNRGFGAAFEKAWEAGWAWAEWSDPQEQALRALKAEPQDFHDPDRWKRPIKED